jgi:hypothetical protein
VAGAKGSGWKRSSGDRGVRSVRVIGILGAVRPAAGFVRAARRHGADTLEADLERSIGSA